LQRQKWQEALGTLALVLPHCSQANLCQVGRSCQTSLSLVTGFLSAAASKGKVTSESDSDFGLQVRQDSPALLAR